MSTTDTASEKISISTKDLSAEDRKMLRGIFFHSFNVFAHYGGGARGGASGFMCPSGLPSSVSTRIKNSVAMPGTPFDLV